jgi:hypothetical protein
MHFLHTCDVVHCLYDWVRPGDIKMVNGKWRIGPFEVRDTPGKGYGLWTWRPVKLRGGVAIAVSYGGKAISKREYDNIRKRGPASRAGRKDWIAQGRDVAVLWDAHRERYPLDLEGVVWPGATVNESSGTDVPNCRLMIIDPTESPNMPSYKGIDPLCDVVVIVDQDLPSEVELNCLYLRNENSRTHKRQSYIPTKPETVAYNERGVIKRRRGPSELELLERAARIQSSQSSAGYATVLKKRARKRKPRCTLSKKKNRAK